MARFTERFEGLQQKGKKLLKLAPPSALADGPANPRYNMVQECPCLPPEESPQTLRNKARSRSQSRHNRFKTASLRTHGSIPTPHLSPNLRSITPWHQVISLDLLDERSFAPKQVPSNQVNNNLASTAHNYVFTCWPLGTIELIIHLINAASNYRVEKVHNCTGWI